MTELRYVAIMNTPESSDDDPPIFDTAKEAWEYLADKRMRAEDGFPSPDDPNDPNGPQSYSETVHELERNAGRTAADGTNVAKPGTVYSATPGCDAGLWGECVYVVDYAEDAGD